MKKLEQISRSLVLGSLLLLIVHPTQAQFLKKVKQEVKSRVERKVSKEVGDAAEDAIDQGMGKSRAGDKEVSAAEANGPSDSSSPASFSGYKSYDFVPGDRIIFQPDLSKEADAELPARFVIKKGNAEIQSFQGEKILHLDAGGYVTVMPLMDKSSYLPEQFTLEFDFMYENPRKDYFDQVNNFTVKFFKESDENYDGYGLGVFTIRSNSATILGGNGTSQNNTSEAVTKALGTNDVWHHVALYFRKNIAKAYIGPARVSATNNFPEGAAKFAILTDGRYGYKIKNVRLAAGGDDKYEKIVTDGKFITHGILFDSNKSSIKAESTGALNEIAKLMNDHSDLNFEIQGHTDSDGSDEANLELSQRRAEAVKEKLVEMGIAESRLDTKGFGEAMPIDDNDTAEGKANNRRVEFIKL